MSRQLRQGLGVHLRLGRLDRGLLTAVPVSIGLLFFVMLAMISCYQRDGAAIWLERMILALSLVAILLAFAFAHILKSWRRSDAFLYTDPLCPCGSRTAMQELLRRLEERRDIDITILYADLNHFKYVNDTFGHEAGDRLLITFSHILSRVFDGQHAMTARVGGDEFVVIFQDVTQREIADAWEQVELDLLEESRSDALGGLSTVVAWEHAVNVCPIHGPEPFLDVHGEGVGGGDHQDLLVIGQ